MRYILDIKDRLDNCLKKISETPIKQGWCVEIKPYKNNRTLNQNSTCHMWLKVIDDFLGTPKDYTKDRIKQTLKHYDIVIVNNTPCIKLWSTSNYDKYQMLEFMNSIERLAIDLNIQLPYPDDFKEIMR